MLTSVWSNAYKNWAGVPPANEHRPKTTARGTPWIIHRNCQLRRHKKVNIQACFDRHNGFCSGCKRYSASLAAFQRSCNAESASFLPTSSQLTG
ncbi:hypothetical protein AOLI_G00279630 [Acnodon oligacanthus]